MEKKDVVVDLSMDHESANQIVPLPRILLTTRPRLSPENVLGDDGICWAVNYKEAPWANLGYKKATRRHKNEVYRSRVILKKAVTWKRWIVKVVVASHVPE